MQHQADTTRAPTFYSTLVRRVLQPTGAYDEPNRFDGRAGSGRHGSRYRCTTMSLICPKCQSKMRSFERSGITVEQCKGCRGVFLDRGELDLLMAAEARFFGLEPLDPAAAVERIPDYDAPRRPVSDDRKRSERLYTEDRKLRGKGKKRKKPFLEDFFE